ncbi:MAG: radical SAM protein [Christensenellales bacterium]|jgi:uncharacterized protein
MPINSLLVKPAGPDCNLACRYCFYYDKAALFDVGAHRIDRRVMREVIAQYLAMADQASIAFQGGEPTLMGADFFAEVADAVAALKRPGQQVNLSIQTNGILLDDDFCRTLRRGGYLVGLSLDGPEDLHDFNRLTRGRAGTHGQVVDTLKRLQDHQVPFNTLTVLTDCSAGRAAELVDYFLGLGSFYMQFIPCVEPAEGGGLEPYSLRPEQYGPFLEQLLAAWWPEGADGPRCYVRFMDELLISLMQYTAASCQLSPRCASNLVIEHDGSVYPCDFFVGEDTRLGRVPQQTLAELVENPVHRAFLARKPQLDPACAACRWRSFCWGDCLKYRLDDQGRDGGRAWFCESYRYFFERCYGRLMAIKAQMLASGDPRAAAWRALDGTSRNQPCPCGSGFKFKACCAGNHR